MSALNIRGLIIEVAESPGNTLQFALEQGKDVTTKNSFVVFGSAKAGANVNVQYLIGNHSESKEVTADKNNTWHAKFSRAQGLGNNSIVIAQSDKETASFVVTIGTPGP
ncbi:hypothetical protein [Pseudomonas oryzicola]|uniref:DUF3277 family protein n=1 Tax=Pseudomonas oryzicola TaxID=485876 RepID=A0ABS6QBH4_9PSED|nr:hypothetical protein [Pseudomonas oryzicola]MBV4491527.1 hypothetical protein [Pseudomonas oryzicola]